MNEPHAHISAVFKNIVDQHPTRPALHFSSDGRFSVLTYRELNARVSHLRRLLAEKTRPGGKVCLFLPNGPDFVTAFFAVTGLGAAAVCLDTQTPAAQIAQLLNHAEVQLLLTHAEFVPVVSPFGAAVLDIGSISWPESGSETEVEEIPVGGHDAATLAAIFFTSGTTELPKAVPLTHANLLSNVRGLQSLNLLTPEDRVLAFLPLHHTYAFTITLLAPLLTGAAMAIPEGLTSVHLIRCMQEVKVTVFVGVPQIFHLLSRQISQKLNEQPFAPRLAIRWLGALGQVSGNMRLRAKIFRALHQRLGGHIRYLVSGGARLDPEAARLFFRWGFPLIEGYGLTETSPVVALNPLSKPKIGSVGNPLPGVNVRIHNPNAEGIGEIAVQGANVMQGYYHQSHYSETVLRDGWFYTGDLGYLDEEGYLFITGREKELIILANGKNISPEELERHYGQNVFVKDIAVLRGESTDKGEHLAAIVVPDEDALARKQETSLLGRIKWELENLSLQLPAYQRIKGLVLTQTPLPRTRLGKLKRHELPELYRRLETRQGAPVTETEPNASVSASDADYVALLKKRLNKEVSITDHLEMDLGLDSLDRMELLIGLQEELQLDISDEDAMAFYHCATVRDLVDRIQLIQPGGMASSAQQGETEERAWSDILRQPLDAVTRNRIGLHLSIAEKAVSLMLIAVFKALFRTGFFLRSQGREYLPEKGPYILCPNHTSYFDGVFVLAALPWKIAMQTYFVGMSQFLEHPVLRPIVRPGHLIPIESNFHFIEALQAGAYVLQHDRILCYFPEGQRSFDGTIQEFKKGIGILSLELGVPCVPIYLEGAYRTWPRGQKWPRLAPVRVRFGSPVAPSNTEDYAVFAEEMRKKVQELA